MRQNEALPNSADQEPNPPSEPAGNAAIAAWTIACRSGIGVSGCQGKGPSWQSVAAYSAELSDGADSDEVCESS